MKRSISSSVLKGRSKPSGKTPTEQAEESHVVDDAEPSNETLSSPTAGLKPRMGGGSGSAWKAGALSDAQTLLNEKRAGMAQDIIHGRYELELTIEQIRDEIGSDRRDDWQDQDAFKSLYDSIEKNGQDTPIQVWPVDPNWQPDALDPTNCSGVQFFLITGRRRYAIASKLGRSVRAVLVPPDKRGSSDDQFEMLFLRFRENEERENLGAFERLLSVGEMFERCELANPDEKITAVGFATMVGVHESHVSRGKAIYKARDQILHTCKNVYELSHRELEKVVATLSEAPKTKSKEAAKPKKIAITRKLGNRNISVSTQGGKLSISASGMDLDRQGLEGLGDVVAAYLEKQGSEK